MCRYAFLAGPLAVALAVATSHAAFAVPCLTGFDRPEETELMTAYLECERLAHAGDLSRSGIAECSEVYEALKHRVFGGSFAELRTWYEQTREIEGAVTEDAGCLLAPKK